MEVYCEQSVENAAIDKKKNKTRVLNIVRYVLLVAGILFSYLMIIAIMGSPVDEEKGIQWTAVILQLVFSVLILVPFVLSFIFIGRYINNSALEFDYLLNNGMFRIVKVINRKKRKKLLEISITNIESMGKLESESYDRLAASKEIKKQFAICDYENEENIYYIHYGLDGTKYLLHIEPNEEMLVALKRSMPRISMLDKSIKMGPAGVNK